MGMAPQAGLLIAARASGAAVSMGTAIEFILISALFGPAASFVPSLSCYLSGGNEQSQPRTALANWKDLMQFQKFDAPGYGGFLCPSWEAQGEIRKLSAILLFIMLSLFADAQFISGVTFTATATSVTIMWSSAAPSAAYVRFGTTRMHGSRTAGLTPMGSSASLTIDNLQTGVLYYFKIMAKDSLKRPRMTSGARVAIQTKLATQCRHPED